MGFIKHIIFDLDGTLVLLPVRWEKVRECISRRLGRRIRSIIDIYAKTWNSQLFWKVSEIVESFELEALRKFKVLDESPRILRSLSSKYSLSLVTLQTSRIAKYILSKLEILELFKSVIGRELVPIRKEQIRLILEREGLIPQETVVIGDLRNDMEAAISLGCQGIFVNRGYSYVNDLKDKGTIIIIDSLKELERALSILLTRS